ncbi:outer membrane beta-barrel protein [Nostoc sp. TCL26-01]|uniref:outer membrane beta-barrel protein n=1 Tax=Nostoc sp. TCL26-01 TaxID=2576904 RepID=UPI0015B8B121|nr:outer membrane beta-barrel protein [Nostoc sp. TCL26-01]QLE57345.1 porin family protein [Nostoc sp. TCL26-01]
MNKCVYSFLLAIPISLSFAISTDAEEVSTKASDLIPIHNQPPQSKAENLEITQNLNTANSPHLSEKNYWYISGSVGGSSPKNITVRQGNDSASIGVDNAFQGNIAVGYQWDEVRAELEVGYGSYGVNTFKSGDVTIPLTGTVSATTVFVNGYWDIPSDSKWRSYIGAGIGVGFPEFSELKSGEATNPPSGGTALALQGKVGIQYELAKKSNVFVELKYQNLGSFSTGSGENKANIDSINSLGMSVGYRQGF